MDELLGAGGHAGEVAVPQADELERVLKRTLEARRRRDGRGR